jgi:hypothetical protein
MIELFRIDGTSRGADSTALNLGVTGYFTTLIIISANSSGR